MASRAKRKLAEIVTKIYTMFTLMLMSATMAYGVQIPTYTVNTSNTDTDPAMIVIGLSLYVCRIIGAGLTIWGIVGFVTARKEGDAGAITSEIGKLAGGLILIFMPAILKAVGIIG